MTGQSISTTSPEAGKSTNGPYSWGARSKTAYPVQWAVGLLSCIPAWEEERVPQRVLLTSFHGDGYRGNTRILFEHLCRHPELEPVWLSRNPVLVRTLKERFGDERACLTHSLTGIRMLRSAGAVFLTHGTSDYPFMRLPRHSLVIQTYHGLPTKRGEYLRPKSDRRPGFLHRKILDYRFRPINLFLSSSPLVSELFASRFNIPSERFLETGFPAYDGLMQLRQPVSHEASGGSGKPLHGVPELIAETVREPGNTLDRLWQAAPPAEKLILYAPTFRRRKRTHWFPFHDLDLKGLARWLEEQNALMALRAHPNDDLDVTRYSHISPRFVSADQTVAEDAAELLPLTDAIVSDYSSIYLEGLLLDIPAVFLPYDLHSYERGLPLSYEQVAPGPFHNTQSGLLTALTKALTRTDGFEEERSRVRKLFFSSTNGGATGRVIRFLEEQLLRQ